MYQILVVDDEENIRNLIKKYAVFEGNVVFEAENGMQAVNMCREHPDDYDIIIMDVMMPELDGFSAVKELRKYCQAPVLMLSARGEEYDKIHGFELGVDDYVVKPFSPKELMMRVNAILKRVRPKGGAFPQRVRPAVLHGEQPEHRPHQGKTHHQRVGLRFLRGRPHSGHPHQAFAEEPGPLQQIYCNASRRGVPF